ncbi:MAG: hypothetical protein NVS3B25_21140 [Hymenobacter sp.]
MVVCATIHSEKAGRARSKQRLAWALKELKKTGAGLEKNDFRNHECPHFGVNEFGNPSLGH